MRMSEAYWHVGRVTKEVMSLIDEAVERDLAGDSKRARAQLRLITTELLQVFERLEDSNGDVGDLIFHLGVAWTCVIAESKIPFKEQMILRPDLCYWADVFDPRGAGAGFTGAVQALDNL
jgi:hypothetical protein